jgi:FkbM family methyltransferase
MLKKMFRTAQTYFPQAQDFRFRSQMGLFRALGRPYRPDYWAIRSFRVDKPLLVDVGASRGMSIATMQTMKPDAEIIAFEANWHVAQLTRKTFEGDSRIRIEPVGLGDKDGELTLYIPVYRGYRFDGLASLNHREAAEWLRQRILGFDAAKLIVEEMQVQIRTLDEFDLAPFLLKLYVQGYEEKVLLGARKTIEKHAPVVIAPSHSEGVGAFLRKYGYTRYSWIRNRLVSEAADPGFVVFYMTAEHERLLRS